MLGLVGLQHYFRRVSIGLIIQIQTIILQTSDTLDYCDVIA